MPPDAAPADTRPSRLPSLPIERIARFAPSRRSLVIGACVVAFAACGYAIARETSLFAIDRVKVTGGSSGEDAQVVKALTPVVGRSLVGLDGADVLRRIDALPTVVSATYDRAFPNTLHVMIVPEHPVAVLRDGAAAWIVSERGRVMRPVTKDSAPTLPRIWAAKNAVRLGAVLPSRLGGTLTRTLAAVGALHSRISWASLVNRQLIFHLRSGIELVLGAPADIPLKVAVAVKLLWQVPSGTRSLDVSVPSRPVASPYSTSSVG